MGRGAYMIRKARKSYVCTQGCANRIERGNLYLYTARPPEDMTHADRTAWRVDRVCLLCAERWGWHTTGTRASLEALRDPSGGLE